jgi:hypothetical protein
VTFPEVSVTTAPAEAEVSRSPGPAAGNRRPLAALPARPAFRRTATAPARTPEIDLEEVYEQVAARLRRELLLDRERVGDLLGGVTGRPPR